MTLPACRTTPARATIDPHRWPDVAQLPDVPLRAAVAMQLLRRIARLRGLRVELPGGRPLVPAPTGAPVLRLNRPAAFAHRVGASGLIGFGESYQAGEWDSPDIVALLTALAAAPQTLVPAATRWLRRLYVQRPPKDERSTVEGARRNIHRHYDLSNDLFALFLDATMTYSSAIFPTGAGQQPIATWGGLPEAQHRKIDQLLDLAQVGPGSRVLEIGTGWGELALRAAERGARVVSLTLSHEQMVLARRRIAAAGYADRVQVRLCDYRAAEGSYDAVVSVEMIEAVGRPFWALYFATIERLLAPGGRAALQAITMPHEPMLASSDTYTWILKYIFPGGQIPSLKAIAKTARTTGLHVDTHQGYGPHYAETLRLWRERFTQRTDEVASLGFDHVFHRMWELYLAYSEAGFRSGYLNVHQILLTRKDHTR
ncbi:class I SAM-dependent methyltransferase [Kitasatospora sp. NPDC056138]|uniref:class I SAM-dependent methyltransferase n=1 Tax=Kitasatospora sp. NPDC056138 TaxID=3345724 RepID=UPI0035DF7E8B